MSAPAPSLPPSPAPPLCVQFLSLSSWGPKVPVGGEGGEAQSAGRLGPSPKCSSPASQHAPLPARVELAGVSEGGGRGGGLMGERRVVGWWRRTGAWSDTGGWLCSGLLFAVPQTSGLLLVANAHLLRDVHQRAGHRQTRLSWRRDAAGAPG